MAVSQSGLAAAQSSLSSVPAGSAIAGALDGLAMSVTAAVDEAVAALASIPYVGGALSAFASQLTSPIKMLEGDPGAIMAHADHLDTQGTAYMNAAEKLTHASIDVTRYWQGAGTQGFRSTCDHMSMTLHSARNASSGIGSMVTDLGGTVASARINMATTINTTCAGSGEFRAGS